MQTNGLENRFQPTVAVIGAGISGLTWLGLWPTTAFR